MKRILLGIVAFLIVTQCKSQTRSDSVWTEKYQLKLSNHLDSVYKSKVPDENKRAGLITYMVTSLKSTLPNGLESVSADSLSKIKSKIGQDYAYLLYQQRTAGNESHYYSFDDKFIQAFRESMLKVWPKDDLATGNKVCDCVIAKLKKEYPDKILLPIAKEQMIRIVNKCREEIMPNNKKE
jgi:hypothetical protein